MKTCICGKSKPFGACCEPLLSGRQYAKTPEQLMRSRYSAYALGGYGGYLLATWLSVTAQGLTAEELSEKSLDWQKLRVISSSQKGDAGTVEFEAWYRKSLNSNELDVMHEVSEFVRIQSRWLYVGGRVT